MGQTKWRRQAEWPSQARFAAEWQGIDDFRINGKHSACSFPLSGERLDHFCQKWQVRELSVFGSILRDDFRADSDVDMLVRFDPAASWSLWDLIAMRDELVDLLGRDVDLVEEEGLRNPFRRHAILRDKRVIYAA